MPTSNNDLPAVPGLRDIPPGRACDRVVEVVQTWITDGRLGPGDMLPPERDLAARFQTSRATVSQALRVLDALGLVEIRHGSGVRVAPRPDRLLHRSIEILLELDRPNMLELVELRGWIERSATVQAAARRNEEQLDRIRKACEQLVDEQSSVDRWLDLDIAFHEAVIDAAGNTLATALSTSVMQLMADARREEYRLTGPPGWFTDKELTRTAALHERIVESIAAGDADAAAAAGHAHHDAMALHVGEVDLWRDTRPAGAGTTLPHSRARKRRNG